MTRKYRLVLLLTGAACLTLVGDWAQTHAYARGGRGGGARPSVGGMGGARPMPRPSMGGGGMSRPAPRPTPAARPSTKPAMASRPSTKPPKLPASRPSTLPADRPNLAGRPGGNRPNLPGNGNRPNTLPGLANRPGGDRPNLPGNGNRPNTLPGLANRPGGNRPNLPGNGNRPDLPNLGYHRPGGGINAPGWNVNFNNNRPSIGGIANNVRPNIYPNRPIGGWGVGNNWGLGYGNHWGNYWHQHCVPGLHRPWYHGCWTGHWGYYGYLPWYYGTGTLMSAALLSNWGYGYGYTNPYYAPSQTTVYNYSQPVMVADNAPEGVFVESDAADSDAGAASTQTASQDYSAFDTAREKFQAGDYAGALALCDQTLGSHGNDPALHEFRALCLFALDRYQEAAAVLNSLLASGPGMDWTTLSGLYGNEQDYKAQVRKLKAFCGSHPDDAAAHFLYAYHAMISDRGDVAKKALQAVLKAQPGDLVAKSMLAALDPEAEQSASAAPEEDSSGTTDASGPAEIDILGRWQAESDGTRFELAIEADGKFTWKAQPQQGTAMTLSGDASSSEDMLLLETKTQGTLAGRVKPLSADAFEFALPDAPPGQPSLKFTRAT